MTGAARCVYNTSAGDPPAFILFLLRTFMAKKPPSQRSWRKKFGDALRGVKRGVRGQESFFVHFFAATAVVATAAMANVNRYEWCLLILCITVVMTAEMFNSALENMAKVIENRYNINIRESLDIAAGAVLIAAVGAAAVGMLVLGRRVGILLDLWKQ